MAAIQKSQDIDTLSVRKIFAKGDNNTTLPANSVLVTDGSGGTFWLDEQTFQRGVNFNTFETSRGTVTSGPGNTKFSILDGENAGLLTGPANSFNMYAKAFGQINVEGQDSVYSFDPLLSKINSNINIVGTGIIDIRTDTVQNKIEFYSPDTGLSSISSVLRNFTNLNEHLSNTIKTFNSPFSTFIYDAISSFSTAQGAVVKLNNFSNVLAINNNVSQLNTNVLNTYSLYQQNIRQPFIQRGSSILSDDSGSALIRLDNAYSDVNYTVQLTYRNESGSSSKTIPLVATDVNQSEFTVYGDKNALFHWTTLGDIF